jgi:hypothetical protein
MFERFLRTRLHGVASQDYRHENMRSTEMPSYHITVGQRVAIWRHCINFVGSVVDGGDNIFWIRTLNRDASITAIRLRPRRSTCARLSTSDVAMACYSVWCGVKTQPIDSRQCLRLRDLRVCKTTDVTGRLWNGTLSLADEAFCVLTCHVPGDGSWRVSVFLTFPSDQKKSGIDPYPATCKQGRHY